MKNLAFTALAASLLVSTSAMAGPGYLAATEGFDYPANTSIVGQNGGTGWSSAWQSGLTTAPQVVSNQGNTALQLSSNSDNAAYRSLSAAVTGEVLIKFVFSYSGVLGDNDFLGLWFGSSAGPNIGLKANCGTGACINDAFARTSGSTTQMLLNSNLQADTSYVLFGHLYKANGSNTYNRFDAWLNPSSAEMSNLTNPDASSSGVTSMNSFSVLGFRTDNIDGGTTVRVDDIEVSVVPEPSSVALLGISMLALCGLRRRRQK
ncbi:MAG: sorting protein [Massilia sp.]|jgi:hypothetical protein|nr:sorting protein [Massilia sp.]